MNSLADDEKHPFRKQERLVKVTFTIAENKVEEVTKLIRDLGGKVLRRQERTKTAEPIKVDDSKARSRAGNNLCTASAGSGIEVQSEVVALEPQSPEKNQDSNLLCMYCFQSPCITLDGTLPPCFLASGAPDPRNLAKRYKLYRTMYSLLKLRGLWKNPEYLTQKIGLGHHPDDVREVMPLCVIKHIRSKLPNPEGIPYKGHVPSL